MGSGLGNPAHSHAENIIADFRINLLLPNTDFSYSLGQSSQILDSNFSQIQNKLVEVVRNTDPNAERTITGAKIGAIIAVIIVFVIFIFIAISIEIFIVMAPVMFIAFAFYGVYICWSRYVKNDLKELLPENVERHIIYPIQRYRRKKGVVAIWMVIRLTKGQIQQPINGPIYWSSNGVTTQSFPFVVQQPQIQVQQQVNMQQQLQNMVQQQQQQIQQLQQMMQNNPNQQTNNIEQQMIQYQQQNQQNIVPFQQPQNQFSEGNVNQIGQTQEYQQSTNYS